MGLSVTAGELLRLRDDGWRHELVRGELRTRPLAGAAAGLAAAALIGSLDCTQGAVYASTGFQLAYDPDTVRSPAVAFVRAERVVHTDDFVSGPPDMAFEVISPGDTYSEIQEKTLDWLGAGVRAVVIIDPKTKTVRVHRSTGATTVTDAIELDDIIPGWRLPLADLFD